MVGVAVGEEHRVDAIEFLELVGAGGVLARRHKPKIVVGTFEICAWMASHGVENCSGMNIGGSQNVLGLKVSQVQAIHTSSIEVDGKLLYGDVASGYVVRLPTGYTFYHAGDTALFSDMSLIAELYRPLLAFLPIGDHFTMDPLQAAHACRFLAVREVIPIHYGTFPLLTGTPEEFKRQLDALGVNCEMIALEPGEKY